MAANRTRLATLIGALVLSVSVGCSGKQGNSLASNTNGLSDAAIAEAITTIPANSLASEEVALAAADPSESGEHPRLDHLKEALGLTDDQVAQIMQIMETTRQSIRSVQQQVRAGTLTRDQAREQIKTLHEQQRAQSEAVLTAEQQAKFAALRTEHDRQFNLERLKHFFNLTDDQVSQIEGIMQATWTQVQEIKHQVEAGTLTPDQAREQILTLHQTERTQIDSVLTQEQRDRLAAILLHQFRDHRHGRDRNRG